MATVNFPIQGGGVVPISMTDNGDGTYSPDVVVVSAAGDLTSITIPLQGGGYAKIAAYLDGGVYTLAAVSV
jgi:hypothetical protein